MRSFLCFSCFFVFSLSSPKFLQSSNIGFFQKNCAVSVLAPRPHTMDIGTFAGLMPPTKKRKTIDYNQLKKLYFAIMDLDCNLVKEIIEKGIDVNIRNKANETPLHEILKINTFNKSNVDKKSKMQIVRYLVENGADIEAQDNLKQRPIHKATLAHDLPTIEYLIAEKEANIDSRDQRGRTPLHIVAESYTFNAEIIIKLLSRHNSSEDSDSEDSDYEPEKEENIETPDLKILKYLLQKHANPNIKNNAGETPLHIATCYNYTEGVEALVDSGALINIENNKKETPLLIAIKHSPQSVLYFFKSLKLKDPKTFHKAFLKPHQESKSPFLSALAEKNQSIIECFMQIKDFFDLEEKDSHGNTALHLATQNDNFAVVKELVKSGVNIDPLNNMEYSPLYYAAGYNNNLKIVEYLIENGATILSATPTPNKILFRFIQEGRKEMLEFFVKKGLPLNERDISGQTPLFYAVKLMQVEIMALMIKLEADLFVKDNHGKSIFFYAKLNQKKKDHSNKFRKNTLEENITILSDRLSKKRNFLRKNKIFYLESLTQAKFIDDAIKRSS